LAKAFNLLRAGTAEIDQWAEAKPIGVGVPQPPHGPRHGLNLPQPPVLSVIVPMRLPPRHYGFQQRYAKAHSLLWKGTSSLIDGFLN
jgi:hypothetical protein